MSRSRAQRSAGAAATALAALLAGGALALAGQEPPGDDGRPGGVDGGRPSVFFDCSGWRCNLNYFRTELPWVNWVRLREGADVHLIMTSQPTGAGGREYQLDFIGAGTDGYEERLRFQTLPTDTEREALDGIAYTLGVGLLHFASAAGFEPLAEIAPASGRGVDPRDRVVAQEEVADPWNFWVFRLGGQAELDGEETRRTKRVNGSFSASRVTPTWKMNFRSNVRFNRREIDLTDDPTFIDQRTDWGLRHLVAYSLAQHWSVGVQGEVSRATRFNQEFRAEFTPALEYSFFPYEEATRRALTAFYKIGPAHRRYIERTVYDQARETRWEQSLEIELSQRQQWGDASLRILGSHFLHDTGLYNVSLRGDVEYRVARGLNFTAEGNISWVNDQIYLSGEGVTDAEALLDLQQRSQDFNYGVEIGFSFHFGSIYNNVVNNRFGGGGGGFRFF